MSDIQVEHLVAGYQNNAVLVDANLHVPSGSLTCVLGPSGCGKTTLLRVIAGFERAQGGSITVGTRVVDDGKRREPAERRNVGYVPQEGALFPHLTIADNIGFALTGRSREARDARRDRIAELLTLVGMSDLSARYPHQLSGGQQQRVAVARALARRPEVVLLDEPFASLDAALRSRLRDDIRAALRASEVTAILVTHDRAEALSMADQVAVMRDGRIMQAGAPHELYTRPADAAIAAFVSDATLLEAVVADGIVTTALGATAVDPESPVPSGPGLAVVRPEQLQITAGSTNGVGATVVRVEYFGHDARVELRIGDQTVVARIPGSARVTEGSSVHVAVAAPIWVLPTD